MVAFLTPAWLSALHEAVQADAALAEATADIRLVVEERVTDGEDEVVFHLVLDHGRAAVVPGPAPSPTVRFVQDRTTATAIHSGTESAQRAFMTGRLRVGGDLRALVEHQALLSALHDVFAGVRDDTGIET